MLGGGLIGLAHFSLQVPREVPAVLCLQVGPAPAPNNAGIAPMLRQAAAIAGLRAMIRSLGSVLTAVLEAGR